MKKALLVLIASTLMLTGATDRRWAYVAGITTTSASYKVSVFVPTTSDRIARMITAYVVCATTCSSQTIIGGTAPTSTLGAFSRLRSDAPATAKAEFYSASNSTGGTALPAIPLVAGGQTLDMSDIEIKPGETVSLLITGASQSITIVIKNEEFYPY
jgi:hypothetical protein